MSRRFAGCPPIPPSASDFLKAVLGLARPFFRFPLPGRGFSFALDNWINAGGQLFASRKITFAGLSEI
jgi:hypothetical protein